MLRKYQSVEKTEVLSPEGHKAIEDGLHKLGKSNLQELDENERQDVLEELDKTD